MHGNETSICVFIPRSDHLTTEFSRDAHDFGYIMDVILMNIKHFAKWTHNLLGFLCLRHSFFGFYNAFKSLLKTFSWLKCGFDVLL